MSKIVGMHPDNEYNNNYFNKFSTLLFEVKVQIKNASTICSLG